MPVEAGDSRRIQLRRRAESDESLEVMMEAAVGDEMSAEPTVMMSLIDLLMLNAIVCGLEFCASAAFCYIPPLLLKAGIRCVEYFVSDLSIHNNSQCNSVTALSHDTMLCCAISVCPSACQ